VAKDQDQSNSDGERTVATPNRPYLRVVHGNATTEEIAALIATLTAVAAARSSAAEPSKQPLVPPRWNSRARLLRPPVHPTPSGWRHSALP
jgi:Acyl-CoA carboxylase epsilon subunit